MCFPQLFHTSASAGVRQANRIRNAYLASVLQQEVAFFDTDTSSGKLLNGLNDDTVTIQNAVGEKVGNFVHHLATFLVGIAIGRISPVHNLCPQTDSVTGMQSLWPQCLKHRAMHFAEHACLMGHLLLQPVILASWSASCTCKLIL